MSDMKCPFCKKELKLIGEKSDSGYPIDEYFCGCPQTAFHLGNAPMWKELRVLHDDLEERREYSKRAEKELIRTRKALEIAIDTIHWYDDNYDSVVARNTLDEIKTALEQKDMGDNK